MDQGRSESPGGIRDHPRSRALDNSWDGLARRYARSALVSVGIRGVSMATCSTLASILPAHADIRGRPSSYRHGKQWPSRRSSMPEQGKQQAEFRRLGFRDVSASAASRQTPAAHFLSGPLLFGLASGKLYIDRPFANLAVPLASWQHFLIAARPLGNTAYPPTAIAPLQTNSHRFFLSIGLAPHTVTMLIDVVAGSYSNASTAVFGAFKIFAAASIMTADFFLRPAVEYPTPFETACTVATSPSANSSDRQRHAQRLGVCQDLPKRVADAADVTGYSTVI